MYFFARFLIALAVLPQIAAAGNAIEFSASLQEFTGQGIIYHRLIFKDDKRTVFYQPPQGWTAEMAGNRLRLKPSDKTFAEAEITSVPLKKPAAFDEPTVAALMQQVLSNAPPTSQQPELVFPSCPKTPINRAFCV